MPSPLMPDRDALGKNLRPRQTRCQYDLENSHLCFPSANPKCAWRPYVLPTYRGPRRRSPRAMLRVVVAAGAHPVFLFIDLMIRVRRNNRRRRAR
ncbi:hypothetical protein BRPE64_ACDS20810 [Caballeronia insecticola]|uniref:Uncharacterized protein n=1 Tax=Caballeronia insecticola TaxID=758793 RepID=R4WSB6_9BURK|nr:hypothetical protein BRPE64_ACDS20810 [Caballeronia insecticola]